MAYQAQLIHSPGRKSGDAGGGTGDMWIIGYDHPGFSGPRPLPTNYIAQALGPRGEAAQREAPQPGMAKARGFSRAKFAEKPLGEWNRYEIVANGGSLTYTLNGERINEGSGAGAVAGKIGLECENTPIAFRKITVTPL